MVVNLADVALGDDFVVSVSLGYYHSCALSTNYTVKVFLCLCLVWLTSCCSLCFECRGYGGEGRLGIGDTSGASWGNEPDEMGSSLPALMFPGSFVPVQLRRLRGWPCLLLWPQHELALRQRQHAGRVCSSPRQPRRSV